MMYQGDIFWVEQLIAYCIENDKQDMLKKINGIVVMNTIFY